MSDDDCDLEALLDVLDEDESEEGQAEVDGEQNKSSPLQDESIDDKLVVDGFEEDFDDPGTVDEDPAVDEAADDDEDAEIQRQLQEMEEKMRKMKEKLKNKSAEKKNSSQQAAKTNNSKENQTTSSSVVLSSQKKPERNTSKNQREEIDIFSASGSNNSNCKKLKSPVKTQPMKECEREKRPAKFEGRSSDWCPSLIRQDTTRVIQGDEADKLRTELKMKDRQRMETVARQDLMDSSDEERDEDGTPVYSEAAKELKKRIAHAASNNQQASNQGDGSVDRIKKIGVGTGFGDKPGNKIPLGKAQKEPGSCFKITIEKNSGIRMCRPLVSPAQIQDAMRGRKMVHMSQIREAHLRKDCEGDWVTFGVLYYKAPPKQSSNGNDFSIWKLTDLKGEIKPVSLFLFGAAHKAHWKTPINKVVGLLNPKILEDRGDSKTKGETSISIDHGDKFLELGDSADIAKCKFVKQDGNNCVNIVNKSVCEYCVYHVKKAYTASSGARHALQSSFSGFSSEATRNRIMQKVAPKSKGEIFGGGQIMNPVGPMEVGRKSVKEKARDAQLLSRLQESPGHSINKALTNRPARTHTPGSRLSEAEKKIIQRISKTESEEFGSKLLLPSHGAKAMLSTLVKEEKEKERETTDVKVKSAKDLLKEHSHAIHRGGTPKLGRGGGEMVSIDVSPSVKSNYAASHARAMAILKMKNKNIKVEDPNSAHKAKNKNKTPEGQGKVAKRLASAMDEDEEENDQNEPNKKPKLDGKPKTVTVFGKEMNVAELEKLKSKRSTNQHLAAEAELAQTDKYFQVMEKKDEMEEKMLGTFEVKTKAVTCHICNYTAFKASDLCRDSGHRYKVIDAVKRFYNCKNCKKRVIVLTKLPQASCGQCGGSSWVRAGMIAERRGPKLGGETLSIRGNEEKFMGTSSSNNINI